ncbi:MAG: cytochrome B [Euryarchaeota archaeon]|nr:cytochrome B [Euryarchaeota archaeon]
MARTHTVFGKVLHWGFVILYLYGIFKQVEDLSQLENSGLLWFEVAFALVFLAIVLMRYFYMRQFDTFMGAWEPVPLAHTYLAKGIHLAMYACFILLPLTGLMIAGLYNQGYTVNATPDEQQTVMDVVLGLHGLVADISYVLIVVHIAAALYSRLKGEGVWTSMVPVLKEKGPTSSPLIKRITAVENSAYARFERFFSSKSK